MTINKYWVKSKRKQKRINKYYAGKLTIRQKEINTNRAFAILVMWCIFATTYCFAMTSNSFKINGAVVTVEELNGPSGLYSDETETASLVEQEKPVKAETMYREFTAYNAGDPYQCDDTPCISASGDNICALLAQGQIIFASNEFPIGTKLYVEGIGEGTVLDRMNSRFKTRIDVAMQAHEKPEAIAFGLRILEVKKLEE